MEQPRLPNLVLLSFVAVSVQACSHDAALQTPDNPSSSQSTADTSSIERCQSNIEPTASPSCPQAAGTGELTYEQQLEMIEDLEFRSLTIPSVRTARAQSMSDAERCGMAAWAPLMYDEILAKFARDLDRAQPLITSSKLHARLRHISESHAR